MNLFKQSNEDYDENVRDFDFSQFSYSLDLDIF